MMADSITPGAGLLIKKNGVFDLNGMYKAMRSWFGERDYGFLEKENSKKEKDTGQIILLRWEGSRNVDAYAQFQIRVNILVENAESLRENNKKLTKGDLEMKFWADVILDYTNTWERKPFGQFLFKLYNTMIIKDKIQDVYETNLDTELQELIALAKSFL